MKNQYYIEQPEHYEQPITITQDGYTNYYYI